MSDESVIKFSVEASMKDFSAKMTEFESTLRKVGKTAEEAGDKARKAGNGFSEIFKGILSAEAVKGALMSVIHYSMDAVKAFDEELQVTMQLNLALGDHYKELIKLAEAYSLETRYSKDSLTQSAAMMANRKLNVEQIKQLLPVAMDWAAKTGKTVAEVTGDFIRGITTGNERALRSYGISVDKTMSQQGIFNKLVASGQGEIKGFAKVMGQVGQGPMIIMLNQLNEMKSTLGEKLLPVFQEIVKSLRDDVMPLAIKLIDNLDTIIPLAKNFGIILATYFASAKIYEMARAVTALEWSMKGLSASMAKNPLGAAAVGMLATSAAGYLIGSGLNKGIQEQNALRTLVNANKVGGQISTVTGLPVGGSKPSSALSPEEYLKINAMANASGGTGTPPPDALANQLTDEAINQKKIDAEKKKQAAEAALKRKEKAEADAYKEWKKSDEEDVEAIWKGGQDFREKFLEDEGKLQKQMTDELTRANEETANLRKQQIEKFRKEAEEFAAIGQSIGESLGQGFVEAIQGNKDGMKNALKSVLIDILSFIEKKMIAAAVSSLVDMAIAGPLAPVAASNAIGKAMMIGALFETLKAGVNSMGDGGPIFGQPHSAGGVIINAEGGEYILKKSAVDKYGTHTIEALNRGLIPAPSLQGYAAQTTIANSSRAASGGIVPSGGDITIVNVTDERQLDRYMASTRGRRAIVNAVGVERYKITKLTR